MLKVIHFVARQRWSSGWFPTEVAIVEVCSGETASWMIRPTADWVSNGDWSGWGVTLDELLVEGSQIVEVTDALISACAGHLVVSDDVMFDVMCRNVLALSGSASMPIPIIAAGLLVQSIEKRLLRKPIPFPPRPEHILRAAPQAKALALTLRCLLTVSETFQLSDAEILQIRSRLDSSART
jgi:hypothetical protein